jgi:hypothetical protein
VGARCGKTARRVLSGGQLDEGYLYRDFLEAHRRGGCVPSRRRPAVPATRPVSAKWWTRLQPIRTVAELAVEFVVFTQEPFHFQRLAADARSLRAIGRALGVDGKTVRRSLASFPLNKNSHLGVRFPLAPHAT